MGNFVHCALMLVLVGVYAREVTDCTQRNGKSMLLTDRASGLNLPKKNTITTVAADKTCPSQWCKRDIGPHKSFER